MIDMVDVHHVAVKFVSFGVPGSFAEHLLQTIINQRQYIDTGQGVGVKHQAVELVEDVD